MRLSAPVRTFPTEMSSPPSDKQFLVQKFARIPLGQYTVVGKVVSGMELVDKIKRGAGESGAVTGPDRMIKVTLGKK